MCVASVSSDYRVEAWQDDDDRDLFSLYCEGELVGEVAYRSEQLMFACDGREFPTLMDAMQHVLRDIVYARTLPGRLR